MVLRFSAKPLFSVHRCSHLEESGHGTQHRGRDWAATETFRSGLLRLWQPAISSEFLLTSGKDDHACSYTPERYSN